MWIRKALPALALLLSFGSFAQSIFAGEEWTTLEEEDGLVIFERRNADDSRTLGVKLTKTGGMDRVVDVLQDVESYMEWMTGLEAVKRIPRTWQTDSAFTYQFFAEEAFIKRDGVIDVTLSKIGKNYYEVSSQLNRTEFLQEDYDRMETFEVHWYLRESENQQAVIVEYTGLFKIEPSWVYSGVRWMIVKNLIDTMENFREY